jgi:hypothetical protein
MRTLAISVILAAGLTGSPVLAGAESTTSTGTTAAPDIVCLAAADIDRTTVPDDKTILFHLKSGKVWRNALVSNCPSLGANGFAYEGKLVSGKVCGSLQQIRVNETKQVCILGPFTEETPKGSDTGS